MNNSQVRKIIPGLLLAILLSLSFMVLREFLLTLAWAMIISYAMWQPYQHLRRQLKNRSTLSAIVMTAIIAVASILVTYWLALMLQSELKEAYIGLLDKFGQEPIQLPKFINRIPGLRNYSQDWLDRLGSDQTAIVTQLTNWAKQWLGQLAQFLDNIGHGFLKLGVILVTVFFCFRDGDEIIKQLRDGLVHFLGEYQEVYLKAVGDTTRAVVYGLVIAAFCQGLVAGFGYAIAGVEAPVLFGAITGLLALVPMGATLIWGPISIMLILMDKLWQGVGLLLWGFLVVSTIDNVVRPMVISGTSRIPFLVVMFGVLGGLAAFGVIGLFLGPVILSVLLSVWKVWLKQQEKKNSSNE